MPSQPLNTNTVSLNSFTKCFELTIKTFVQSNCWGIFPEGKKQFKPGDLIEWMPLIPSR